MTLANNILGAISQLAPAGQSTNVSKSSSAAGDFNAVLAALLGTDTPAAVAPPAVSASEKAEIDLAALQSAIETDASTGVTEEPTIEDLIANMLEMLEKLGQQLESEAPVDADLVAQINAGIATLLEGKAPTLSAEAKTAPGQDTKITGLVQLLSEVAQKLTAAQPELAQKLDALVQKLSSGAQTAEALPPEVASAAAAARGKTSLENAAPTLQQPREGDLIAALENKTKAVTEGTAKPGDTPINAEGGKPAANAEGAKPATGETRAAANAEARLGQNGAQPPLTANPPVNPSQPDSLLFAQTIGQPTAATDGLSAIKPMTAAYQSPVQNLNMPHIAVEFVRHMRDGASRFQIRMDPPEMGRIDVKLDMDNAGNVNARLTVERADTLDLLQRDARALERALAQAGLDTGRTNLEFSLKQNPFARQDNPNSGDNPLSANKNTDEDDAIAEMAQTLIYRGSASPGGVNMIA